MCMCVYVCEWVCLSVRDCVCVLACVRECVCVCVRVSLFRFFCWGQGRHRLSLIGAWFCRQDWGLVCLLFLSGLTLLIRAALSERVQMLLQRSYYTVLSGSTNVVCEGFAPSSRSYLRSLALFHLLRGIYALASLSPMPPCLVLLLFTSVYRLP